MFWGFGGTPISGSLHKNWHLAISRGWGNFYEILLFFWTSDDILIYTGDKLDYSWNIGRTKNVSFFSILIKCHSMCRVLFFGASTISWLQTQMDGKSCYVRGKFYMGSSVFSQNWVGFEIGNSRYHVGGDLLMIYSLAIWDSYGTLSIYI